MANFFKNDSWPIKLINKLHIYIAAEPYEVWLSVAFFLGGIAAIVNPKAAGALGRILPLWEVYTWGSCILIGSSLTLYGLIGASRSIDPVKHRLNREWERLGQLVLGISTLMWSTIIFSFGMAGTLSGLLTLFLSFVCFTRALILKAVETYVPLSRIDALRSLRAVTSKIKSFEKDKDQ